MKSIAIFICLDYIPLRLYLAFTEDVFHPSENRYIRPLAEF